VDIRSALKGQYHAGLAMLRQAVAACPDDLWLGGVYPRTTWRIAYHACFYTHLYLGQSEDAFVRWPKHRNCASLWEEPDEPQDTEPFSRAEIIEYIDHVDELVDPTLDAMDLDAETTGFWWYDKMDKLSHQIMNIRHLQGHVGQLSELIMAHGADTQWVAHGKESRSPL
jgi:hypothetical protein